MWRRSHSAVIQVYLVTTVFHDFCTRDFWQEPVRGLGTRLGSWCTACCLLTEKHIFTVWAAQLDSYMYVNYESGHPVERLEIEKLRQSHDQSDHGKYKRTDESPW